MGSTNVRIRVAVTIGCIALAPWAGRGLAGDPAGATVPILIARHNLRAGTRLDKPKEMFEKVPYLLGYQPRNTVSDFHAVRGKVLTRDVYQGQLLRPRFLADDPDRTARPVQGMRAFTVTLWDGWGMSGGSPLPGSRVDVISADQSDRKEPQWRVVVQNVLLLAINPAADEPGAHSLPRAATLQATPEQVLKLVRAGANGRFGLVLRPFEGTPPRTVTVLVARQDLDRQTHIQEPEKLFKQIRWTAGKETRYAIADFQSLKDLVTVRPLKKGQPVFPADLIDPTNPDESIPKGKRAIAIRVAQGAGGLSPFIRLGCKVDVMAVTDKQGDRAALLMENLPVRWVDRPSGGTLATVTLEVTLDQAWVLAKVKNNATFQLCLRPQ